MSNLLCYKQFPVWTKETLPKGFQQKHNTKAGTWAKLTILQGALAFYELTDTGDEVEKSILSVDNQADYILPEFWHKVVPLSDDLQCQLEFYCTPEDYYHKKYRVTATHSEVINAMQYVPKGRALDLGCGSGRNALYLNLLDFEVDAVDKNEASLTQLNHLIEQESLENLNTALYDIEQASIAKQYDFIYSTVVLMFLRAERIPDIIDNMQQQTNVGGYNLIVCAVDSEDYPYSKYQGQLPFQFGLQSGELANYYQDWDIIKYNEDVGHLHRLDSEGNPIALRFATVLAKKVT